MQSYYNKCNIIASQPVVFLFFFFFLFFFLQKATAIWLFLSHSHNNEHKGGLLDVVNCHENLIKKNAIEIANMCFFLTSCYRRNKRMASPFAGKSTEHRQKHRQRLSHWQNSTTTNVITTNQDAEYAGYECTHTHTHGITWTKNVSRFTHKQFNAFPINIVVSFSLYVYFLYDIFGRSQFIMSIESKVLRWTLCIVPVPCVCVCMCCVHQWSGNE